MKQNLRIFPVFLLIFVLFGKVTMATHNAGGEITYRNIGPSKYEVTITVYRDCNGQAMDSTFLYAKGHANDTISVYQLNKISVRDITGIAPNCGDSSRCKGGSSPFGFEQHVWVAELDLSGFSSCNWTLGYGQCCRSSAITTGAANTNFYQTAYLNNCLAVQNSSPVFTTVPQMIICLGQDAFISFNSFDTLDNTDSLSYELADPLVGMDSTASWINYLNKNKPLTFWGFPNNNLGWPAGFHLDPLNGWVYFRPAQTNQVSAITVEVKEWRRINGDMVHIGTIRREVTFQVKSCQNSTPWLSASTSPNSVCAGSEICINFSSSDANVGDTVRLSYDGAIPDGIYTHTDPSLRLGRATLCWTPGKEHVRSFPYTFTVIATDNACPIPASVARVFSIYVREQPSGELFHQDLGCGKVALSHNYLGDASYQSQYVVKNSNQHQVWQSTNLTDTAWLSPGKYYLSLNLTANGGCQTTLLDSFTITDYVQVDLGDDLRFCLGDSLELNADITLGQSPYQISWFRLGDSTLLGSGTTNFFAKPQANQAYTVWVEDDAGCLDIDTIQLRVHEFKDNNLDSLYYLCENETLTITPIDDPSKLIWNWSTGDTSKTIDITRSGSYWLQIEDSNGCSWVETFQVQGIEVKPVVSGNLTVCKSDSVYLLVANADSFVWYNSNMAIIGTDSFIRLNTTPDAIHLRSYRSVGLKTCSDFQTFEIKNYDSIPLWIEGDNWVQKGVTHNYSAKGVGYSQYQWTTIGGQIESGQFTSTITASWQDTGVRDLILYSTDSNGCRVQLNKEINIGLTSIKNIKQENINLYPNPGKGLYTLEYSGNDLPQRYVIINALGQQVAEGNLNGRINKIDIESQKAGMYLLILEDGPRIILIKE